MAIETALIYTRVSEDKTGEHRSVTEQEAACRRTCEANGWTVTDTFSDNDIGASRHSSGERNGWGQVIARIGQGDIDVLVVWEFSRTGRDLGAWVQLRDALERTGTKLSEGGKLSDLSDSSERLTLGVKSVIAESAADETSARVRRSLQANADRGRPHGRLLYGYRRLRDDRTGRPMGQVPDHEQAAVVRRIFAEYNAGSSLRDVADGLNAEGITTESGGEWVARRIGDMTRNVAYAGRRTYKGEDVGKGDWEPLVDMDAYLTAERRREAATFRKTRAAGAARLLSGVIRCGVCSAKMYSGGDKLKSGHAYVCSAPTRCTQRAGLDCDNLVTAALLERIASPDVYAPLRGSGEQSAEVIDATNRVAELEAQLDEAADQFAAGELSAKMLAKVEQRLDPMIAEARKAARQAAVPLDIDIPESGHVAWWEQLDPKVRREVVNATIAAVVVQRSGAKRTPIFDPSKVSVEWAA